jgi:carbonic anhydrase
MWLRNIKDVYRLHRDELEEFPIRKREDRLTELECTEAGPASCKTSIIQRAWQHRQGPDLHGLEGLKDGPAQYRISASR